MRQVLALVAGALLAALGAVVLGEYPLQGATAVIGFPLYGIAVAELALAVAKRLGLASLVVVAAIVGAGLAWALWISFGHFRNDVYPPTLSWVMVGAALVVAVAWGWPRRRAGDVGGSDGRDQAGGTEARHAAGLEAHGPAPAGWATADDGGDGGVVGDVGVTSAHAGGANGAGPARVAPAGGVTGAAGAPARGGGLDAGDGGGEGTAAPRRGDGLGPSRGRDEEVGP